MIAAIGRQLKQSVKVFHRRTLNLRLPREIEKEIRTQIQVYKPL